MNFPGILQKMAWCPFKLLETDSGPFCNYKNLEPGGYPRKVFIFFPVARRCSDRARCLRYPSNQLAMT